jgi:hypothetical protein
MFTYRNGYTVTAGTYWNVVDGRRVDVCGEAILMERSPSMYLKAPVGFMLAAIPVAGLIYIVLMPFLGMTAVATVVGVKILNGLSGIVGKSISFGWKPKNAYLSGKKKFV